VAEEQPIRDFDVRAFPQKGIRTDYVAVEEPIEIHVDGQSLAVLMRTPGADKELVAGFLCTEGVIDAVDDLRALEPCADPNKPNASNTLRVHLSAGCERAESRLERARRHLFATSSCGLCGKATIEALHQNVTPHESYLSLSHRFVEEVSERVLQEQAAFQRTGGLHAAALFGPGPSYELLRVSEDIGRHNAVDKVIGWAVLQDRIPLGGHSLWVSGRASFEVTQKALVAGIGALVTVGAPSSLAVETALASQMTLVGFARGGPQFNVYAGQVHDH
jgi:FdhD protein